MKQKLQVKIRLLDEHGKTVSREPHLDDVFSITFPEVGWDSDITHYQVGDAPPKKMERRLTPNWGDIHIAWPGPQAAFQADGSLHPAVRPEDL